jgi:hypothetical protein
MNKAKIVFSQILKPRGDAPEVLQPGNQPLDSPAPLVAAQLSSVLRLGFLAVHFMRRNHLDALALQLLIERVTVIGFITNQANGLLNSETRLKSICDKGDFVRRSTCCVGGDRKRSQVCHHQEFRAFAPLSLTNSEAPFLAATKVPSIKHSDKSICPRWLKSWARVSKTLRNVPSLTHCPKRRWQVWYGGKVRGKSFHLAPERKIQRMPLRTSRFERQGRPLPSSRLGNSGSRGSRIAHCSSVSSSPRAIAKF